MFTVICDCSGQSYPPYIIILDKIFKIKIKFRIIYDNVYLGHIACLQQLGTKILCLLGEYFNQQY